MKDLDFDELDRAVSSVLGTSTPRGGDAPAETTPAQNEVSTQSSAPTQSAQTTPKPQPVQSATAVAVKKPAPTQSSAIHGSTTTNSVAAKRPTGRFMDVVHPSSDMKQAPSKAVSRHGVSLSPNTSVSSPKETPQEPQRPQENATTSANDSHGAGSMPDPMEFSGYTPDEPAQSSAPVESTQNNAPAPKSFLAKRMSAPKKTPVPPAPQPQAEPFVEDEQALLESPFITGTQVEKRPLGFFSRPEPEEETPADNMPEQKPPEAKETAITSPVVSEDAEGKNMDEPAESSVAEETPEQHDDITPTEATVTSDESHDPLPEELQREVLSIESDETNAPAPEEAEAPQSSSEEVEKADEASTQPQSKPAVIPAPASNPQASSFAVGSIAPQYKEKVRPQSNEATGSIYDTDTYHQPLQHPAKKKSGWLSVLLILLIIILGAAAGAAVYFFVL